MDFMTMLNTTPAPSPACDSALGSKVTQLWWHIRVSAGEGWRTPPCYQGPPDSASLCGESRGAWREQRLGPGWEAGFSWQPVDSWLFPTSRPSS